MQRIATRTIAAAASVDAATRLQHRGARLARVLLTSAYQSTAVRIPSIEVRRHASHHAPSQSANAAAHAHTLSVAMLGATAAAAFSVGLHGDRVAHARAAIEPLRTPHRTLHKWHLFDQIGAGAFGTVRIGMHEDSGEVAAVKIVDPNKRNYSALEREISALKLVKALGGHCNIIDLKDVYVDGRKVCLVTELARGGELFDHIVAFGAFSDDRARVFASEIGSALGFLHRHGLVHKDVKPENILLSSKDPLSGFAKLADFGSAGPAASASNNKPDDIGTSAYLSPEFLVSGECTAACDMWALGCVLYIVLSGSHPFDLEGTASDSEVEARVKFDAVTFDFAAWTNVSTGAKDVISKLLAKDPRDRLTADELLLHPWIVAQQSLNVPALVAASTADGSVQVSVAPH